MSISKQIVALCKAIVYCSISTCHMNWAGSARGGQRVRRRYAFYYDQKESQICCSHLMEQKMFLQRKWNDCTKKTWLTIVIWCPFIDRKILLQLDELKQLYQGRIIRKLARTLANFLIASIPFKYDDFNCGIIAGTSIKTAHLPYINQSSSPGSFSDSKPQACEKRCCHNSELNFFRRF